MSVKDKDKLFKMFLMTHDMYDFMRKKLNEAIPTHIINETLTNILQDPALNDYDKWLKYRHNLVKLASELRDKPERKMIDASTEPNKLRNKTSQTRADYVKNASTNVNMGAKEQYLESLPNSFIETTYHNNTLNDTDDEMQKQQAYVSAMKTARKLKMREEIRNEEGLAEHEFMDPEDLDSSYQDESLFKDAVSTPKPSSNLNTSLNLMQQKQKNLASTFDTLSKPGKKKKFMQLKQTNLASIFDNLSKPVKKKKSSSRKPRKVVTKPRSSLAYKFWSRKGFRPLDRSVAEYFPSVKEVQSLTGKGLPLAANVNKWESIFY